MKCDNCIEKCPQEELACEIAKGRMYATNEVVRLQKELKEIKAKAIDEFAGKMIIMMPGHKDDILLVAKQMKKGE